MNTNNFVAQMNSLAFQTGLDSITKADKEVGGFSGPYVMKILNLAISNMEDGECYLEIGTHQGKTLIGGMIGNENKVAVAVDNFSQFNDDTEAKLHANIEKFGLGAQIHFFKKDSDMFFEAMPVKDKEVGVYFYDGDHDTEAGLKGLCDVVPYLANEAVIILDDFSSHGAWRSIYRFLGRYPRETALLFAMRTNNFPFPHEMWWNGIIVISWKADRNTATGV